MSEVTFSISKGRVVLHKDGANLALSLQQLSEVKALLPAAEAELLTQLGLSNEDGKKCS